MVREKIGLQTDRHGDNISVFFPMRKKALKTFSYIIDSFNRFVNSEDRDELFTNAEKKSSSMQKEPKQTSRKHL